MDNMKIVQHFPIPGLAACLRLSFFSLSFLFLNSKNYNKLEQCTAIFHLRHTREVVERLHYEFSSLIPFLLIIHLLITIPLPNSTPQMQVTPHLKTLTISSTSHVRLLIFTFLFLYLPAIKKTFNFSCFNHSGLNPASVPT
jgi:hypothetical protein